MSKKKIASVIAYVIFATYMAYHEISQIIEGGHDGTTFSFFNFNDNIEIKSNEHTHEEDKL